METALTYDILLETAIEIKRNPLIYKQNMKLEYVISEKNHIALNEQLFYKSPLNKNKIAKHTDVIEVAIGGVEVIIKHN